MASKVQVVLAKLVDDVEVVSAAGVDLGRRAKTREIKRAVAMTWASKADAASVERARAWASSEGYTVFIYSTAERDPLERAKREVAA